MSVYTALCSRALFPLHERLKGHASVATRERLERSQWWPRETIESDRVARLRRFLVEAGTHAELLAREGIYARLYQTQFSRDEEAGGERAKTT